MATFGYTSAGGSGLSGANPVGSKFVAPDSGTITEIQVYTVAAGEGHRVAIYADSAGSPSTKLAESSEVTAPGSGSAWEVFTISLAITSGTTYWLMAWGSNYEYVSPGDVADQMAYMTGNSYPTWPDPFNETAFLDRKMSIYAVYTPSATGNRRRRLLLCGR